MKKVKVNPRLSFFQTLLGACLKAIGPLVPEKVFKVIYLFIYLFFFFYHMWAWWSSWSCESDAVNKLPFPLSMEDPYKILLWLA